MPELLRDIALSFAPAWVRGAHRPRSPITVLRGAVLTGLVQMCLCAWQLLIGYQAFLTQRMQQYGQILTRGNETTQAWFGGVFSVEYILFHPLALFLSYLALEGLIRFVGGLCASEVVPSLPVVLFFAIKARMRSRPEDLPPIPDEVEALGDAGRFRIAAASAKVNWNASLTIEIGGECYEIEREETGSPPRTHIYLLHPVPLGKIRRGYERYDLPATMKRRGQQKPAGRS
jgi:hypothetical protein